MQKNVLTSLFVSIAFAATVAVAQTSSQQPLPDSPSAGIAPPPQQKPATQPKPAQTQPKKDEPILKSLEQKKPAPQTNSTPEDLAPPPDSAMPAHKPAEPQTSQQPNTNVQANPDDLGDEGRIVKQVNEVNLIFTVTDKRGRYIKDLKKEDFQVLDDRKPAEAIRNFAAQTNLPLRVGLLIDASSSIRQQFKFEQEAAIEFLNQVVNQKSDLGFTVGFDATPEVTQDFTRNTEDLSKGIRMIRPGGGTALYDAVFYSCRDKLIKQGLKDKDTVRRALIVLSDGDDNQSRVTREEAVEMCQRAETIIYTISTDTTSSKTSGDKVLERLSDATGGRAFYPYKIEDVANAFHDIQDELRSQYSIAYKPADFVADGRFRPVEVIPQNKKLKVRVRKGYFAPRPNAKTTANAKP